MTAYIVRLLSWPFAEPVKLDLEPVELDREPPRPSTNPLLARSPVRTPPRRSSGGVPTAKSAVNEGGEKPEELEKIRYESPGYPDLLEEEGNSFMSEHELGIHRSEKVLCRDLLDRSVEEPFESIFAEAVFGDNCDALRGCCEAKLLRYVTALIVPSAEITSSESHKRRDALAESVDEPWKNCISITSRDPQPDFAVGFKRSAFNREQKLKLKPYIGKNNDRSYCRAMHGMWFPFLTCEVKSGRGGLDIADRQNAHSMTVAMAGIVGLFESVNRERELHQKILGFSISHDDTSVRIYGHYVVFEAEKPSYHRHSIASVCYSHPSGRDKWVSYTFVQNVYDHWAPKFLEIICSAVDDLPDPSGTGKPKEARRVVVQLDETDEPESAEINRRLRSQLLVDDPEDLQENSPTPSPRSRKRVQKGKTVKFDAKR